MYVRQVLAAITVGISSGVLSWHIGYQPTMSVLVGLIGYISTRWLVAWIARIRYWYNRGVRHRSRTCPDCGQYIYRQSGDWLLECKQCGWRAGLPVVRWLTRSVPSRQLRRTLYSPHLFVVLLVGVVVAAGGPVAVADTPGPIQIGGNNQDGNLFSSSELDVGASNRTAVRAEFRRILNEERLSRGLQPLSPRNELQEMGQSHAETMAEHDYLGHETPNGTTIADRYRSRGLLPECRLPIAGSPKHYEGAENAAQTWVNKPLNVDDGPDEIETSEQLARSLFEQWMHSPEHKRVMVLASADEMGLGVKIRDEGKVYAALEFC